jgi:hypothetical protein
MQTMNEWSAEISQFLSHQAARHDEAFRRVAQCQNVADLLGIQAHWVQHATEGLSTGNRQAHRVQQQNHG